MTEVILSTAEPATGAAQYVRSLAVALQEQGAKVTLLCPSNFAYDSEVAAAGVEIRKSGSRAITLSGILSRVWRNIKYAAGAMQAHAAALQRGTLAHFQFLPHAPVGFLVMVYAALRGARVALTAHDPLPHRWAYPKPFSWLEERVLSWTYRIARLIIVHNEAGREVLAHKFRVPTRKIVIIPHGPLFAEGRASVQPPQGCLKLLLFGSIRHNKGIHLAIQGVQEANRNSGVPVHLTIAGELARDSERKYWNECKDLIEKSPDHIQVLNRYFVDSELPGLIAEHHALILPYSQFVSESGVAALALSNGRPILATVQGGLGELLRSADCGITIESPDVDTVVRAIEKAREFGRERLAAMGANGYDYVIRDRSWQSIARRTIDAYQDRLREQPALRSSGSHRIFLHSPEPAAAAALYVTHLARALHDQKIAIGVICPSNHQFRKQLEAGKISVECSAARPIDKTSAFRKVVHNLRFLASSCGAILRATKPGDCIHFQHVLHFPLGAGFFLVSRWRRLRIVFTVHDPVPHNWVVPSSLRWFARATLRWAYSTSDVLIVHSEAGKRTLLREFAQDPARIAVIPHGPYPFDREPGPMPPWNRFELLLFGSIRENKGVHLAIEAAQRLYSEGMNLRLTIAGSVLNRCEQSYWEACRQLIGKLPDPIVVREEFVPDEYLPELFGQAHCLLLPYTKFASDSGVAFMALANSRTIIATRAGGLSTLLDSTGGIAIESDTVEAVCDGIRRAFALGPKALERLGQDGATYVMNECAWPKVARQTIRVYEQLGLFHRAAKCDRQHPPVRSCIAVSDSPGSSVQAN